MTKQEYKIGKLINALRTAKNMIELLESDKSEWAKNEAEATRDEIDAIIESVECD